MVLVKSTEVTVEVNEGARGKGGARTVLAKCDILGLVVGNKDANEALMRTI